MGNRLACDTEYTILQHEIRKLSCNQNYFCQSSYYVVSHNEFIARLNQNKIDQLQIKLDIQRALVQDQQQTIEALKSQYDSTEENYQVEEIVYQDENNTNVTEIISYDDLNDTLTRLENEQLEIEKELEENDRHLQQLSQQFCAKNCTLQRMIKRAQAIEREYDFFYHITPPFIARYFENNNGEQHHCTRHNIACL